MIRSLPDMDCFSREKAGPKNRRRQKDFGKYLREEDGGRVPGWLGCLGLRRQSHEKGTEKRAQRISLRKNRERCRALGQAGVRPRALDGRGAFCPESPFGGARQFG